MRRILLAGSALLATVLMVLAATAPAVGVTVTSEGPDVKTAVGRHFDYRARIVNDGSTPTGQLLVHLNVASLSSDVYVDPEDWSTNRSRFLPALAPGAAASLSWDLQAVSPGAFAVYVVVLPAGSLAENRLAVSSPARVAVTARRTLNAGGALPVAIAVPALLGLATLATRSRGTGRRDVG